MTSQLNNLSSEIAIAKSAAASSTAKVTKLLTEVHKLKFSNNILSEKFNDISNQLVDISNLVHSLDNFSSLDISFSLLNNEISALDVSFSTINSRQQLFDTSLSSLKTLIESISGENLLEKLINVSGEIITLEEDFSGLRQNVVDLSSTVNNLSSTINALNDLSNTDLSFVSHSELDASLNNYVTISALDVSFSTINSRQQLFDSSLSSLKTLIESISGENLLEKLINVSGEIITLEEDFSGLRQNVVDLSSTVNSLSSTINALNDLSNTDLSFVSHSELDASLNNYVTISALDVSFSTINSRQQLFDSSLSSLKTLIESISGENLLEKLINVSGEIITLEEDFSGLRQNVVDLSSTVNNLSSTINALNDLSNTDLSFVSHSELDASLNNYVTISALDVSFSTINSRQQLFDSSLSSLKTLIESISGENLLEKLINVSGEIITLEEDFSGLRQNVVDLSSTVNNLSSTINALNDLSNTDLSFVSHSELDASLNNYVTISALDVSFSTINSRQQLFDSSLSSLKTLIESISGENLLEKLINVSGEIITLEEDFSGLRQNVVDLSSTVNNLSSTINALNDLSNTDLSFVSHSELDASLNNYVTISALDVSFSTINSRQQLFDSSLSSLKTLIESISGENLLEKLINVSGEIITLEEDFSGLRQNVVDLSSTVNNLSSTINALNDLSNTDLSFVSHSELDASLNEVSIDLGVSSYTTMFNRNEIYYNNIIINSKLKKLINILNSSLNLNINFNNL